MKKLCTLLLTISFFSCVSPVKNEFGTGCIRFQNYNQEIAILPDELVNMINDNMEIDSCFLHLSEMFNSQEEEVLTFLRNFLRNRNFVCSSSKKMTHSQIKFLEKQRTINMDYIRYFYIVSDIPDFTPDFVPFERFYDFWYLGKTTLNSNYASCLILMRGRESVRYCNNSSLFLLNIKDKQLLSITRIADYSIFAGEGSAGYLKMEKNKIYSYRVITYSEMIVIDELGNINYGETERVCGRYRFDKRGYVKSLRDR
jgi:hypothetical protein